MTRRKTHSERKGPVAHHVAPVNGRNAAVAQSPRRALVVEADPGTRDTCVSAVKRCGLIADIVEDGVAAVSSARRGQPDLIIVDMQLRDSTGLEVIRWLRSNPALKSTPTIVLSTNAGDVSRNELWDVDAVILKPLTLAEMESTIRDLLAAPV